MLDTIIFGLIMPNPTFTSFNTSAIEGMNNSVEFMADDMDYPGIDLNGSTEAATPAHPTTTPIPMEGFGYIENLGESNATGWTISQLAQPNLSDILEHILRTEVKLTPI